MPATFISAVTGAGSGVVSVDMTVPTCEVDDRLVFGIGFTGSTGAFTHPEGLVRLENAYAEASLGHFYYTRVADGTEPESYTVSWADPADAGWVAGCWSDLTNNVSGWDTLLPAWEESGFRESPPSDQGATAYAGTDIVAGFSIGDTHAAQRLLQVVVAVHREEFNSDPGGPAPGHLDLDDGLIERAFQVYGTNYAITLVDGGENPYYYWETLGMRYTPTGSNVAAVDGSVSRETDAGTPDDPIIVVPDESWETLSATAADLDATLWPTRQPVSVGPDNESGRETLDGPAAGFPTSRHQHEGSEAGSDPGEWWRLMLL